MDWCSFGSNVLANVVGGLVVLAAAYFFVEKRLSLRETKQQREQEDKRRQDEREQDDRRRSEIRESVLKAVHFELESNASYLQIWLKELPTEAVPYPGFDLTGWPLVTQIAAMTTLKHETFVALGQAYNRMKATNDQLAVLSDLNHGQTGIMAAHLRGSSQEPLAAEAYDKFLDLRDEEVRPALIERVKNLKGHLETAIDAVESELGMKVDEPAAQREYVPEQI